MKRILVRAPKKRGTVKEVSVLGHRDPRGPDNTIAVWVDQHDKLHIRVLKADRCYRFERVVETAGYIEVIQK